MTEQLKQKILPLFFCSCWDIAVTEYKWIYNGPIVVANVVM